VGIGDIGSAVAERANGLGMKVVYYDVRRLSEEQEKELGVQYGELSEIFRNSDFLSLHVPHCEETDKMLGAREFELMKSSAFLINVSRGRLIDENALYEALKSRQIAGAGLDVYELEPTPKDNPLLELENVAFTPHSAANWPDGENIHYDYQRIREDIDSVFCGGNLVHAQLWK
jgi:phosphoglycerate dehydrogenase-like enzyme